MTQEKKAKFYARTGINSRTEIDADSIVMVHPNGTEIELSYRQTEEVASIYTEGRLIIYPWSTNVVRVEAIK